MKRKKDDMDDMDDMENVDVMDSFVRFLSGYFNGKKFSEKVIHVDVSKCKTTQEADELADAEARKHKVLYVVKDGEDEIPVNKAKKREAQRTVQKYRIGDVVRLTEIIIAEMSWDGFDNIRGAMTVTGVRKDETDEGIDWWYELEDSKGEFWEWQEHYLKKFDGSEDDEDIPYVPRTYVEMTPGDIYYQQEEYYKKHPSTFHGTGATIDEDEYDEGEIGPP